jgi:hypothetical protein
LPPLWNAGEHDTLNLRDRERDFKDSYADATQRRRDESHVLCFH